ncbi:Protein of unknown function [Cotesia congregata]|uniref:Uncharacterized protein n=1 Tax=Cotesia congregata TaxID=51543 RepID=A0A8J2MNK2_COTCN|nr:Protein of unknown function [Cotesia congregata]
MNNLIKRCRFFNYKFMQLTVIHRRVTNIKINPAVMTGSEFDMRLENKNDWDSMEFFSWLKKSAPIFPVNASKVCLLNF